MLDGQGGHPNHISFVEAIAVWELPQDGKVVGYVDVVSGAKHKGKEDLAQW